MFLSTLLHKVFQTVNLCHGNNFNNKQHINDLVLILIKVQFNKYTASEKKSIKIMFTQVYTNADQRFVMQNLTGIYLQNHAKRTI